MDFDETEFACWMKVGVVERCGLLLSDYSRLPPEDALRERLRTTSAHDLEMLMNHFMFFQIAQDDLAKQRELAVRLWLHLSDRLRREHPDRPLTFEILDNGHDVTLYFFQTAIVHPPEGVQAH